MALLDELRDLFGRPRIMEEDAIRAATLRTRMPDSERPSGPSADFIASAEAELTVDLDPAQDDGRALALVNKTNQFNLNGRRYTAAGWQDATRGDAAFAMVVAYRDRFGPLGRIAVLAGRRGPDALDVSTWVLSCRAFARHIEHRCVAVLFDRFKVPAIHFDFAATARNGPARDFFTSLLGREPDGPFVLTRSEFEARCPALHQSVHVNV
jgi:FkbH-like protein